MFHKWSQGFGAIVLMLGCVATADAGFLVSNSTPGLFDASSGTRQVTVTGTEVGFEPTVTDIDVIINFAKADGESFNPPFPNGTPFHNEIVFRLTSPGGTTVTLIAAGSFNTGSGIFDGVIRFDDAASSLVNVNPNTPQSGTFRPTGPGTLADFNGQLTTGNWTLFIQDTVGADALRFRSFDLVVNGGPAVVSAVPAPAGLVLLLTGLGSLGLGRFARRRKTQPTAA